MVVLPIAVLLMLLALAAGVSKLFLLHGVISQPFLATFLPVHGHLMVFGFLAILLATERYIGALAFPLNPIVHVMPFLVAAGTIIQLSGLIFGVLPLTVAGATLLVAGFIIYVYAITAVGRRSAQPLPFRYMSLAAITLISGAILSIRLSPVQNLPFMMLLLGFPILTVLGERVELTRFVAPAISAQARYGLWFVGIAFALILFQTLSPTTATRPIMIAWILLLLAVAVPMTWGERKLMTRGEKPLHRYLGIHLVAAYGWLLLGLLLLLVLAIKGQTIGLLDAAMHSLAVGFIGAMILAHAPIILPAIIGKTLREERLNTLPLWLLTVGNLLRVVSGVAGETGVRSALPGAVSGGLTVLTVFTFVFFMARAIQFSVPKDAQAQG